MVKPLVELAEFRTGNALGLMNFGLTDEGTDCDADSDTGCDTDCGTDCSTDCGTYCSTDCGTDSGGFNVDALEAARVVKEYLVSRRCARTVAEIDGRVDIMATLGSCLAIVNLGLATSAREVSTNKRPCLKYN